MECKFFQNCNASICPLDDEWPKRSHLKGEKVCFWLVEYSKEAARPILRGLLSPENYKRIAEASPSIAKRWGPIRRQLRRSSSNPPRVRKMGHDTTQLLDG